MKARDKIKNVRNSSEFSSMFFFHCDFERNENTWNAFVSLSKFTIRNEFFIASSQHCSVLFIENPSHLSDKLTKNKIVKDLCLVRVDWHLLLDKQLHACQCWTAVNCKFHEIERMKNGKTFEFIHNLYGLFLAENRE